MRRRTCRFASAVVAASAIALTGCDSGHSLSSAVVSFGSMPSGAATPAPSAIAAGWGEPGQIYLVTWGDCGPSSADEPTRVTLHDAHAVTVTIGRIKGTSHGPVCPDSLIMSTTYLAEPTGLDDQHQVEVDVDVDGGVHAHLTVAGRGDAG